MNWFRTYHDIIDDPKILALSRVDRWHVVAIYAIASRQIIRGTLPSIETISIHLRLTKAKTQKVIDTMINSRVIDVNPDTKELSIHGWSARQFRSDDVSERSQAAMARMRERSREQPVNPRARSETETETETEKTPLPPQGRNGHIVFVLPDWIPSEPWAAYIEMRQANRKKLTPRAKQMLVTRLEAIKARGFDLAAVLDAATIGCWSSVYAPDERTRGPAPAPKKEEPLTYYTAPKKEPKP